MGDGSNTLYGGMTRVVPMLPSTKNPTNINNSSSSTLPEIDVSNEEAISPCLEAEHQPVLEAGEGHLVPAPQGCQTQPTLCFQSSPCNRDMTVVLPTVESSTPPLDSVNIESQLACIPPQSCCAHQHPTTTDEVGDNENPENDHNKDNAGSSGSGGCCCDTSSNSEVMCRICHCEGEVDSLFIAPCLCAGSLKFVHQACLQRWIKSSDTRYCELCKFEFLMKIRTKPISQWQKLELTSVERRKIICSVTFHMIALTCVIWSLYVLIERTAEEVSTGELQWPFWTKLIVIAIGVTGGVVFMYVQCKVYEALCRRWRSFNRSFLIQSVPDDLLERAQKAAKEKQTGTGNGTVLLSLPPTGPAPIVGLTPVNGNSTSSTSITRAATGSCFITVSACACDAGAITAPTTTGVTI